MSKRAPSWMPLEEWKCLAEAGAHVPSTGLRKAIIADEIVPVEDATRDRTLRFVISTGSVDRDRDVIDAAGWELENFQKSPVVLFAHDYRQLPVAKATRIWVDGHKLIAEAEFAPAETYPFAETVFQMLKGGFLNATSVGFRPLKWVYNEERKGVDFSEQELLEFSIVPVPANAEALIEARAAGVDTEPMKAWAEGILKGLRKPDHEECPLGQECPMRGKSKLQKPEGFEIQTVIFPKTKWDSADAVRAWLREHDFKTELDETDASWRARQRDPGDFERMRTICLTPADTEPGSDACRVQAVGGPLKAAEVSAAAMLTGQQWLRERLEELETRFVALESRRPVEVEEFDLATIPGGPPDECEGIEAADVLAALQEVMGTQVATGVKAAVNRALGRVD